MSERLSLVVAAVDDTVPGVRSVRLVRPDGASLPGFTPGSHVVVTCGPPGAPRQRVLPHRRLRRPARLHDLGAAPRRRTRRLALGARPDHRRPGGGDARPARRSRPCSPRAGTCSWAGGIGVTPILSHLRSAVRWGRDVEVLYAHRPGAAAHLDDLRDLAGDALTCVTDRTALGDHLERRLADQPVGTHLYTCGPAGFMDTVTLAARRLGWPDERIHVEHFGVDDLDPGEPFEAVLRASGRTVAVPSGTSLLDALEGAGLAVPNLCRQGVCGECRVPVAAGTPLHRDLVLTDAEKAAADTLLCCVSRAADDRLELDL
ncbi:MAG: iron-sulfur cluster-binding domain-containing protein [Aeromicrobium erythreum]